MSQPSPNWTGLPRLPLAIGLASPSCRLNASLRSCS
jgi:hypothetical protein